MRDVIIIGGGAAGLFAAYKLAEEGRKDVMVIDQGKFVSDRRCALAATGTCVGCGFCDMMSGIGGSGLFSDGKLILDPHTGGELTEFTDTEKSARELIDYIDNIFVRHGAPDMTSSGDSPETRELCRKAANAGIKFIPTRQRHLGSDILPKVIDSITGFIKGKGIEFMTNTEVLEIRNNNGLEIVTSKGTHQAKNVIVAPGRSGAKWLAKQIQGMGLGIHYNPIDVGVRVEVPAIIMDDITGINWDPKFHIRTKKYDDHIRTFCTCPRGFVVHEKHTDFQLVNGHSMKSKESNSTNFAFLTRVGLTEPVEDTILYGQRIARLASMIGGGKPLLQRLSDLRAGRRSTWSRIDKSYIEPTLKDVTPGDISMAMPYRVVSNIVGGLELLDNVIPGVASDATLLYAPEIKFHAMRVETNKNLETQIPGLYAAGDGAGVSRGIVQAACTGVIAARDILGK